MNRKRIGFAALSLMLAFAALTGCGAKPAASLREKGLELAEAMSALAGSQEYRDAVSASAELGDVITRMAGDYSAPKAVYAVTLSEGTVEALLGTGETLPESLADWFMGRACASIGNMIASKQGVSALAAAASVSYGRSFVYAGLEKPVLYLYQYDGDYSVAVSFVPGDDTAVSGAATFVPSAEAFRDAASADDVRAWLTEQLGYEVTVESVG